jgi:osmoprotectant transport system permease protein
VVLASDCLRDNAWICGEYLRTRSDDILAATTEHVTLTVVSVLLGIVLALPLTLLARRSRALTTVILGASTALYTVPSLALFALLLPWTGLTEKTVVIGLVLYSLTILVRAFVAGLDAVPADVVDAARGMGLAPRTILAKVELPLALPTMFAGIRVAVVSTVALVTIGFVVGYGGLGNLIQQGLNTDFKAQVLAASVVCVLLAFAGDLLVLGVQRLLTPWTRAVRG